MDELAQLNVRVGKIDGREFGTKELVELLGGAMVGLRFELQGATFEVLTAVVVSINQPFDGS